MYELKNNWYSQYDGDDHQHEYCYDYEHDDNCKNEYNDDYYYVYACGVDYENVDI